MAFTLPAPTTNQSRWAPIWANFLALIGFDNNLQTQITNITTGVTSVLIPINTQTSSYVLVLTDAGICVEMNVGSANTLTIPPHSSVAFPVDTIIMFRQQGAGATTITAGAGVTIDKPRTLVFSAQYATASAHQRATDEWCVDGNLT
jgi:hypothetical protein